MKTVCIGRGRNSDVKVVTKEFSCLVWEVGCLEVAPLKDHTVICFELEGRKHRYRSRTQNLEVRKWNLKLANWRGTRENLTREMMVQAEDVNVKRGRKTEYNYNSVWSSAYQR